MTYSRIIPHRTAPRPEEEHTFRQRCPRLELPRLVEGQPEGPRVVITDKFASYAPALLQRAEHRAHKELNNRAENSHQPTRTYSALP